MQRLSKQIAGFTRNSSFIRKMFEQGIILKKQFGAENVFDFSLGNPDLPPPKGVADALRKLADRGSEPFIAGYMPNAGYPALREKVAAQITREQSIPSQPSSDNIILTCGAAGGINAFFRAVIDPGDEVLCPSPYFVEYSFYAANFGASLVPVPSVDFTFELNLDAIASAITPRTRVMMINSPNNPTGVIYSRAQLKGLAAILREHSRKHGRVIYLLADEPYRFLNYDKAEVASVFELYEDSVIASSYSKSLSLAGARIGYLAVNPAMEDGVELINGLTLTNRILGFVNAPVIAQHVLSEVIGSEVDVNTYRKRRQAMAKVLDGAGIEYSLPQGAFYFFPRSPIPDDMEFCAKLMENKILAVPGSGFGCPGYFRLAFCVNKDTIVRSATAFKKTMENL